MTVLRTALRVDATDLPGLVEQLNGILARLSGGGMLLRGLRLEVRSAAPSGAPAAGDPNVVVVSDTGTAELMIWTGAAWVVVGTQT